MKEFLQSNLLEKIPLSTPMSIDVLEADAKHVILTAPLEGNTNHQQTGFGGSIYSVAVLAGWGLLTAWLKENEIDGGVVIKTATMNYFLPVIADFRAEACFESDDSVAKMSRMLEKRGRSRIRLTSRVMIGEECVAELDGEFVLALKSSSD